MAAAYVNFSEVFEVLYQLILQVCHDILRFGVLRKLPEGDINPLEDTLLEVNIKFVNLVRVDKVAPSLQKEDSEIYHLGLSQRDVPR